MLVLGIETSGIGGSLALVRDGCCIAERSLSQDGRRHARTLVAELGSLLTAQQLAPTDLDAVAVSIGPGSFTGLRVGVVCAKTLAWGANTQVIAVDTFLVAAAQAPADVASLQVVGDGQRGDLYVGRYERLGSGEWTRPDEISICPADRWLESLTKSDVVTGPGLARHAEAAASRCRVLPPELRDPQAGSVALLGAAAAERGEFSDLWALEPFYLRRSAAEEKADSSQQPGRNPVS